MATESNVFSGPFGGDASAIVNALGYTPVNRAGDTMTGALTLAAGGVVFSGGSTLINDAANVVALKNGTNAQEFRVYATTTGSAYGGVKAVSSSSIVLGSFTSNTTSAWLGGGAGIFSTGNNGTITGSGNSNNASAFDYATNTTTLNGSNAPSFFNIAQTWSTSGNPFLIKANVTLSTFTGSNTVARLASLQVGGAEKFGVDLNGNTYAAGGGSFGGATIGSNAVAANGIIALTSGGGAAYYTTTDVGPLVFRAQAGGSMYAQLGTVQQMNWGINGTGIITIPAAGGYVFSSTSATSGTPDIGIFRASAGVLSVRNGANSADAAITAGAATFSSTVKVLTGQQFWLGNAIVTGLTPAVSAGLLSKSVILQDVAGNSITVYGS